jgi:carboxylesterase type B
MYTDWGFLYGIAKSVELQAKFAPVYCYFYNYKLNVGLGSLWVKPLPQSVRSNFGSVHGDDVLLVHSTPAHAADDFKYSEDETKMTENLLGIYDSFTNDG